VKAGVPEGKAERCIETTSANGTKSTVQAEPVEDSNKVAEAKPVKPVRSKSARSHLRRSWFGRADLLTMFGR
jgi:hypothetical protein